MHERRALFHEAAYVGQGVNPTAKRAIARADDITVIKGPVISGLRPMRIDRLIQAGGILTLEEQARVRYHQLGDLAAVASELGGSVEWVREACAWDMAQEQKIA